MAVDKEYALGRVAENISTIAHLLDCLSKIDARLAGRTSEEREKVAEGWRRQIARAQELLIKYEAEALASGATDVEVARAKRR